MTKLTPAVLKALKALEDSPEMKLQMTEFRSSVGIRGRAFYPFLRRIEGMKVIDNKSLYGGDVSYVSLTFAGMQALKQHFEALYAERPCDAYRCEVEKRQHLRPRPTA